MVYEPLSVRRGLREPLGFHPGIPPHIRVQVTEWVKPHLIDRTGQPVTEVLDGVISRMQWPIVEHDAFDRLRAVMRFVQGNEDYFLDLLHLLCQATSRPDRYELDRILEVGMSEWRVMLDDPSGLEERLTDETRAAFSAAMSHEDGAVEHLADAWSKAFGRTQEPGGAWHAAVKAVEAVLQPVVEPKNPTARLGTMVPALKAKPEKWTFVLASPDGQYTAEVFLRALQVVGYEPGRHGTDPERATIEQARVVVLQAVTIVEWLRAGALKQA